MKKFFSCCALWGAIFFGANAAAQEAASGTPRDYDYTPTEENIAALLDALWEA